MDSPEPRTRRLLEDPKICMIVDEEYKRVLDLISKIRLTKKRLRQIHVTSDFDRELMEIKQTLSCVRGECDCAIYLNKKTIANILAMAREGIETNKLEGNKLAVENLMQELSSKREALDRMKF